MSRTTNARARALAAVLGFAVVISAAGTLRADDFGSWSADAAHTEINFSVTHFFTPVTGRSWAATLVVGDGVDIEILLEAHYK